MLSGQQKRPKGEYVIRLASLENRIFSGIGRNAYSEESFCFSSMWEMVKAMEENMDRAKFPQNTIVLRSWEGKRMEKRNRDKKTETEGKKIVSFPGGATFVIRVQYRQNASWQGSIQWLEGKQTLRYRGVLELLKLMEDAVERIEPLEKEPAQTWK